MKKTGDATNTKIEPLNHTHYEYRVRTNTKSDGTTIYTDPTT